jgi:hypothetical protein
VDRLGRRLHDLVGLLSELRALNEDCETDEASAAESEREPGRVDRPRDDNKLMHCQRQSGLSGMKRATSPVRDRIKTLRSTSPTCVPAKWSLWPELGSSQECQRPFEENFRRHSEFESYMPSEAVRSLRAVFRSQKFVRHSRELWGRQRVSLAHFSRCWRTFVEFRAQSLVGNSKYPRSDLWDWVRIRQRPSEKGSFVVTTRWANLI